MRALWPRRLRSRWAVIVVAALLLGTGGVAWASSRSTSTAAPTTTRVVTASLGTFKQQATASGTFAPAHEADLTFPVSGVVTGVSAVVGQGVKAGQTVATLDSAALAAQVAQAQATVAGDTARLAASTGGSAAQQAADQAGLTAAQQQLASAQAALAQAALVTPITGTVAAVALTTGQQVSGVGSAGGAGSSAATRSTGTAAGSSGTSSAASSAQVVVISTDAWIVNATVDDTEVGLLAKGQQAVITPNGSSSSVYGLVSSVGLLSASTSGVALFPVVIDVTGSPAGLHDGAGAQLAITVKQQSDVLEVPTAAITYSAGQAQVTLAGSKSPAVRAVSVGQSSAGMAQILSGLVAGDQVVVRGQTGRTARTGGTRGGGIGGGTGGAGTGGGLGGGGFGGAGGGFGAGGGAGGGGAGGGAAPGGGG